MYEGDYMNGQKSGKGTYTFASGDVYIGDYKGTDPSISNESICSLQAPQWMTWMDAVSSDDLKNGKGVYRFATGDVYEGEFVCLMIINTHVRLTIFAFSYF